MSEWQEFTAKTVDEALTNAVVSMQTSSDQLEYEVIEEGSSRERGRKKSAMASVWFRI